MILTLALEYIVWHFTQMPLEIARAWRNILLFNLEYFSLPALLKTLFSPWRRIEWSQEKGFKVGRFFETLASNLISRILGACIRSTLIIAGIGVEALLLGAAFISLAAWLLLPLAIVLGFSYGFSSLS